MLDIYSQVTNLMQQQEAVKVARQIGKPDAPIPTAAEKPKPEQRNFQPTPHKHRNPGTGGIYPLNDHLWKGKYSPRDAYDKRISRNVYAYTREECGEKLVAMIEEMKTEIASEKIYRKERLLQGQRQPF